MKALFNKETEMEKHFRLKSESNSCRLIILLTISWCIYLLINQYSIQWFEIAVLNILFNVRFILKMYYQKKMIGSFDFHDNHFWISLLTMIVILIFSIIWWIR